MMEKKGKAKQVKMEEEWTAARHSLPIDKTKVFPQKRSRKNEPTKWAAAVAVVVVVLVAAVLAAVVVVVASKRCAHERACDDVLCIRVVVRLCAQPEADRDGSFFKKNADWLWLFNCLWKTIDWLLLMRKKR